MICLLCGALICYVVCCCVLPFDVCVAVFVRADVVVVLCADCTVLSGVVLWLFELF